MGSEPKKDQMDFKQVLFASYANIAIMELKLYNTQSDRVRPTHKEILYLYSIWSRGGCTASDLVELFDSSKALVSQTVLSMEEKGYIYREKDPADNRRQIITINKDKLNESVEELMLIDKSMRQLSSQYTDEEMMNAARIMYDLTDNMVKLSIRDSKKHR